MHVFPLPQLETPVRARKLKTPDFRRPPSDFRNQIVKSTLLSPHLPLLFCVYPQITRGSHGSPTSFSWRVSHFIRPTHQADPNDDTLGSTRSNQFPKTENGRGGRTASKRARILVGGRKGKMATVTELVAALTQSQSHQQVRLSANRTRLRGEGRGAVRPRRAKRTRGTPTRERSPHNPRAPRSPSRGGREHRGWEPLRAGSSVAEVAREPPQPPIPQA